MEGSGAKRISPRSRPQDNRQESGAGSTCLRCKPDEDRNEKGFCGGKNEKQTRLLRFVKGKRPQYTGPSMLEDGVGVGAEWHIAVASHYVLRYRRIFDNYSTFHFR